MYEFETIETTHGKFDNSTDLTKSAEEVYQGWLVNKDTPPILQPNKIDICLQQLLEANNMIMDLQFQILMI